jgi:endonuclease/exonuclease/phosphatase family metal-dependent hydrolase
MKIKNNLIADLTFYILLFLGAYLLSCETGNNEMDDNKAEIEEEQNAEEGDMLQLTVASYNLRREGDEGEKAWSTRKVYAKQIITKYDFDIFGTQECFKNQILDILEPGNYASIGVGRDDGADEGEHTAIIYKNEKFEVLDKGNFWLSETPDQPSWGWNASKRRVCSWGKFKEKETGIIFFLFNTHFDTVGPENRLESSKLVLKKLKTIAGDNPVFFTGDLNALPSEESIKLLSASGKLGDSRIVSVFPAFGTEGTAHGYNLDGATTQRIDYIFVSETIKVLRYGVINDDIDLTKFSSDHFPVMIKTELQNLSKN